MNLTGQYMPSDRKPIGIVVMILIFLWNLHFQTTLTFMISFDSY